jgi:hypothetical protein
MENSITHSKHSRSSFARFGQILSAAAFALLIGAFAIGTARADDHGHHGGGHGGDHGDHGRGHGHDEGHHGGHGYYRGPDVVYGNPDYYYEPAPDYYYEPDPYDYGYYPPEPGYYPPGPSEGIRDFFGL